MNSVHRGHVAGYRVLSRRVVVCDHHDSRFLRVIHRGLNLLFVQANYGRQGSGLPQTGLIHQFAALTNDEQGIHGTKHAGRHQRGKLPEAVARNDFRLETSQRQHAKHGNTME